MDKFTETFEKFLESTKEWYYRGAVQRHGGIKEKLSKINMYWKKGEFDSFRRQLVEVYLELKNVSKEMFSEETDTNVRIDCAGPKLIRNRT